MIKLKDTEGQELTITTLDGDDSWYANVGGSYEPDNNDEYKIKGISLNIHIPEYLTDGDSEYSSLGFLYCDLKDVFQSYLDDVIEDDAGKSLPVFIQLLESFANKAKQKQLEINNTTS